MKYGIDKERTSIFLMLHGKPMSKKPTLRRIGITFNLMIITTMIIIIKTWINNGVLKVENITSKRDGRDVPCVIVGEWITSGVNN